MDEYLDDGSPEPMQDYPVREDGREESMDMQGDKLDSGFHDKEGGKCDKVAANSHCVCC